MATKQLHLSPQLPLSLGQQAEEDSLSVVFAAGTAIEVDLGAQNYGTPDGTTQRVAAMLGLGSTAVSNANPVPISDAGGSITIDGTVAATQSGTWDITDITGSITLPTGAATETTLDVVSLNTGSTATYTSAINDKLPASLGSKLAAASLSVVLASDGALPLPTGAATEATLVNVQNYTDSINTKLPSTLGAKTSAASLSVVLASDQATITATQSTSNIAYQAKGKIVGSSLTGSYATVLDPSSDLKIIYLINSCNNTILVSLDSGSTDTFELEAGESVTIDLASSGLKFNNTLNIQAKHGGAAPTSGSIRVTGIG